MTALKSSNSFEAVWVRRRLYPPLPLNRYEPSGDAPILPLLHEGGITADQPSTPVYRGFRTFPLPLDNPKTISYSTACPATYPQNVGMGLPTNAHGV
jgi:hypothetical protein